MHGIRQLKGQTERNGGAIDRGTRDILNALMCVLVTPSLVSAWGMKTIIGVYLDATVRGILIRRGRREDAKQ